MKTQCPQCLAVLPPTARLCSRCGVVLPARVPEPEARAVALPAPESPSHVPSAARMADEARVPGSNPAEVGSPVDRFRRAFAVGGEIGTAKADVAALEAEREHAAVRVGEAALELVPEVARDVVDQIRRIETELAEVRGRSAELESILTDSTLDADVERTAAVASAAKAERDVVVAEVRDAEQEIKSFVREAERAEARARATREEADKLGLSNLTAEARIRREAELELERIAVERAAADARAKAAGVRERLAARADALRPLESAVAEATGAHDKACKAREDRREELARAGVADRFAESVARADRLDGERRRLLALVAESVRPENPASLAGPLSDLASVEERLAVARDAVAALGAESLRLRGMRLTVIAVAVAVLVVLFLLAFEYSFG